MDQEQQMVVEVEETLVFWERKLVPGKVLVLVVQLEVVAAEGAGEQGRR